MQMSIEVKGLDKLVGDFATAAPAVKTELNKAINFVGVRLQREARIEAPVRTGNLRSQIRFKNTNSGHGVVGSYVQYSIYVHEGTRYQKANPFMERALANSRADINVIFDTAVRNIGDHLRKG